MNEVINTMKGHRSIREFKDLPVKEELVRAILSAAQCASTSNHIQAYTIIRVNNREKRRAIAELAGPQSWVERCPLFLVFCADLHRLDRACKMQGKEMVRGYTEQFIIATVDTALVAQNAMLAAESLGLGGVYIGGIRNDPQKVSDLLRIPDNVYPVFGMCLGYPDDDPEAKPRLPLEVVLKEDEYTTVGDEEIIDTYDDITSDYYKRRSSNKKDDSWTKQVAQMMSQVSRPHMRSFIVNKGFDVK
ncbi:MAG: oxygen-insensitive NADPH nitroreductase [Syntrophaceae bacterium]|nr:oxygen-insensitive NADPH nitroreductase [Syntrophaceae bacterium]